MDADKVKACGEEIKSIASDYCKIIDDLYEKIKNIEDSGIWVSESAGGAAKKFKKGALNDYNPSISLGKDLVSIGSKIVTYAENVNQISDIKL